MSERLLCFVFVIVLVTAGLLNAEIPQMISYQGKVTDSGGVPVADGDYPMRFRIYDDPTAGILKWDSEPRLVSVLGGVFSVLLGESPQDSIDIAFYEDYWLQVNVAGIAQTPRVRLASVGYAYMASGLVPGTEVSGSVASGTYAAIKGVNTATAGSAYGGLFESASTGGRGVYGYASATAGTTYGVYGWSASTSGRGVYGWASAATGTTFGVRGTSASTALGAAGVYGLASATSGSAYGVWGETASTAGTGVSGYAPAISGISNGVSGVSAATNGTGVYGSASATTGLNWGVYGKTNSPSGYGGYFDGDVHVTGSLSKASGSFLIDHPLDPENKLLRHNFVESPENLMIYRGEARLDELGEAVVEMPDYFGALAKEDEATVNLTPVGKWALSEAWPFGYEWSPERDAFTAYGHPGKEVAWMVMAERDDPVIRQLARPVEEDKGPNNKYCDRGELLHPTAYGYPESMGRDYERHEEQRLRTEEEGRRMEEERGRMDEERARPEREPPRMTEVGARP